MWEVGQEVICSDGYGSRSIQVIEKVTPTGRATLVGEPTRQFRSAGSEINGSTYHAWSIRAVRDAADREAVNAQQTLRTARITTLNLIRKTSVNDLDLDTCIALIKILRGK